MMVKGRLSKARHLPRDSFQPALDRVPPHTGQVPGTRSHIFPSVVPNCVPLFPVTFRVSPSSSCLQNCLFLTDTDELGSEPAWDPVSFLGSLQAGYSVPTLAGLLWTPFQGPWEASNWTLAQYLYRRHLRDLPKEPLGALIWL